MEQRRGRLGARTLPCDCGEKRRTKGVWICLGEKLERGEREFAASPSASSSFCKMRDLEAFIVDF